MLKSVRLKKMNKKVSYLKKNQLLQLIKYANRCGNKLNHCIYHPQNSNEHEDKKWEVFKRLRDDGCDVLTEATFTNGCRADIVAFTPYGDGIIVEILHSETKEQFENKIKKYPEQFTITSIRSDESVEDLEW